VIVPTPSLRHDGWLDRAWYALERRAASESSFLGPLRRTLTLAKFSTGDYSQSWQPCARAAAGAIAGITTVDACVGEHGPDAGLFLAATLSVRQGVPWVADFRDPILMPFRGLGRRVYRVVARRLLRTASATVTVTPSWSGLDRELFDRPSFTVRNGFDPDELPPSTPRREDGRLIIAYTGQVLRPYQRLEIFLDGLRQFSLADPERGDRVRFVYAGPSADVVARLAAERHVTPMMDVRDRLPRERALELLRSADVALMIGMSPVIGVDWTSRGFLPGKTYEYIGAGLPILCAPSDDGDLERLLERAGAATFTDTPEDVKRALDTLLTLRSSSPAEWARFTRRDGVECFSRRESARRLAEILDAVVEGRAAELEADRRTHAEL